MTSGSVTMETVFLINGDVTVMETVWMDQMKWSVLVDIDVSPSKYQSYLCCWT